MKIAFVGGKLYTGNEVIRRGSLIVDGEGRIEAAGESVDVPDGATVVDVTGKTLLPGFVDIHVHGGGGHQMMDGDYAALNGMSRFHAAHGTTSFLATTSTDREETIERALRNCAAPTSRELEGAELLGVHLEGPFLNEARAGAQNKSDLRAPDERLLRRFLDASGGAIRLVTLAPELAGGMEMTEMLAHSGVTVSIGHSDASYAQALEAIERGASQTTHHFNGMSPLHHREPGVAGAGLLCSALTTELICDGIHVHPAVVKLLFDVKGAHKVCMITDAVMGAGLPDGDYGKTTKKDGQIWLKDGSSLAGSSLTMVQAMRNAMRFTGYPIERLLPSFTEVPARQVGAWDRKGSLAVGKDADFLVVDEQLALHATYVRGREAYRRAPSA